MQTPNIFDYATSELSQDAFLCWLLSWANADYADTDNHALHKTGVAFIQDIMTKCRKPVSKEQLRMGSVDKQYKGIDVLAEFSQGSSKYVLVIEDKTDTTMHGDQLTRYRKIIEDDEKYRDHDRLLVYLKTGAISRAQEAKDADYTVYSGKDLLKVLAAQKDKISNNIFRDFYAYLQATVARFEAFQCKKVDQWTTSKEDCTWQEAWASWNAWEGFFSALQSKIEKLEWEYAANQSGGELVAYWCWDKYQGCHAYLEFHVKLGNDDKPDLRAFLAFKISEVPEGKDRGEMRNAFHANVMASAKANGWGGSVDKPPRFGSGNSMVCCQTTANDCWLATDADGKLDMAQTVDKLKIAEKILSDACLVQNGAGSS